MATTPCRSFRRRSRLVAHLAAEPSRRPSRGGPGPLTSPADRLPNRIARIRAICAALGENCGRIPPHFHTRRRDLPGASRLLSRRQKASWTTDSHPAVQRRTDARDETPNKPYFVHEEEVPRAGVHVTVAYQRTRWLDGRTFVWLCASKTTGRGEASSGLAFDQLVPTDFKPA